MASEKKEKIQWWAVTFLRGPKKKKIHVVVRADNAEDAKILAMPKREDVFYKVREIKGPEHAIESFKTTYDPLDVYESLGNSAGLLRATVPVDRALLLQIPKAKSPHLRYYLHKAVKLIQNGENIADAFAMIPNMCDRKLIALIRVAESSDKMDTVFEQMKVDSKKKKKIIGRLKSAAIYPYIVSCIVSLVFIFFSFSLIPKMNDLYKSFNAPLPWFSQIVFTVALTLKKYAIISIPMIVGGLIMSWVKKEAVFKNDKVMAMVYKMPNIGPFLIKNDFMMTVKSLAMMIRATVPLDQAMDLSEEVINNAEMKTAWKAISADVKAATGVSESFNKHAESLGPLGPDLAAIVMVGEEGSNLDTMLFEYAQDLETEVDQESEDMQKMIEPILMFVMSLVVGALLISVYYPIITLGQAFQHK